MLRVRDLMQEQVVTLDAGDVLNVPDDVVRVGRARHFPVVSGGIVVGVVSQRDLYHAAVSSLLRSHREPPARIPVKEAMSRTLHAVAPDRPLPDAVATMLREQIGCLPVVENGKLVGLLSESDCLRHLSRLLAVVDVRHPARDVVL